MKYRIIGILLIVLALIVGAGYGFKYYRESSAKSDSEIVASLEQEAKENAAKAKEDYLVDCSTNASSEEELAEEDGERIRVVDNDVVAKITIPACDIDYLVYENEEADFYLRKDADGNESRHGEIYTNCYDCKVPIIYGHHMTDGTMFAGLDCAYRGATITLEDIGYLDDEIRTYTITDRIKDVPAPEVWDTIEDVDEGLILITCSYGVKDGRLIIIAKEDIPPIVE